MNSESFIIKIMAYFLDCFGAKAIEEKQSINTGLQSKYTDL